MAKSRSSIAERASDDDDDDDDDDSLRCRLRADAHPSTADPEVWKGARRWGEVCGEGVLTRTGTITGGGYALPKNLILLNCVIWCILRFIFEAHVPVFARSWA